jgi:Polyketide cyclase / dehydrase and lipid transport
VPRVEIQVDSDVPAERVLAAATDFSDRRPEYWPNISRRYYSVHGQGAGWAECTEGGEAIGGIWARERYEWSGNRVVGTMLDSNVFASGTWTLTSEPRDGGSRTTVVFDRRFKGKGYIFLPMVLLAGRRMFTAHLEKTLDAIRKAS